MSNSIARLFALAVALAALPAVAGEPSAPCRDGATRCREAWVKLDECTAARQESAETACTAERAEAEAACKESTSACHTDGSRNPPTSPPSNSPTAGR